MYIYLNIFLNQINCNLHKIYSKNKMYMYIQTRNKHIIICKVNFVCIYFGKLFKNI
jgi:hypothetical protein